ncbi:hypothetical protein M8C21_017319, partial [Ambrosia artemisiifolia]
SSSFNHHNHKRRTTLLLFSLPRRDERTVAGVVIPTDSTSDPELSLIARDLSVDRSEIDSRSFLSQATTMRRLLVGYAHKI